MNIINKAFAFLLILSGFLFTSCGPSGPSKEIKIDGSSTVYPITEAVAEEYRSEAPNTRVTVGFSGTGGGFKKFLRGETDINDASRAISASETETAKENGIDYVRLSVAFDGLAVVANPENDWVDYLTVEELKKIWRPSSQGKVTHWSDVREEWPDKELHLFGPGVASGTYDYFTEAIVGESGSSRGDFTASEDDNVLVQGVSTDQSALGFFGLAFYEENMDKLKLVPIENENGKKVKPSMKTVSNDTYSPLSRPLFIYVNKEAAKRKPVQDFVNFYLSNAGKLAKQIGYVPMPDSAYQAQKEKFKAFYSQSDTTTAE
ncbi:phosphate ABC transporter substrate-binding protein, PhoT family [Fodinibius salinus]|uniref:Phosphate-binding protein n=1 Tax=Fodinibius salinus TaxID=860790 RepID=A0A5D3YMY0_9BACT|nr:PstS family phosphate ABC transporter substrate-binding protein [Fodinibius salinus]TYP95260.1 phosphate ABC transporter substrate-binding protein, PhoT family [Fodinibius salinus]